MDFHREKIATKPLETGIRGILFNLQCELSLVKEIPEELSNIVMMSKSAKKACTLRDVVGKKIGRV